jgi:pyridoxal phosphate enzyme (YggS family)
MSLIGKNLESVRQAIAGAAVRAGRDPSSVRLVAVSKTHPAAAVSEAVEAGQTCFGESRVQEALPKISLLPGGLEWHFIGHLQTNKIRKALPAFTLFHGVDSPDVARQMDRIAGELGLSPEILLEVNVSGEETKFGFQPEALRREIEGLLALPRVRIGGLMTMAPYSEDSGVARRVFAALRELRDELAAATGAPLATLSMGMSGDFEAAVEEGSTLVRVGSSIFGGRTAAP